MAFTFLVNGSAVKTPSKFGWSLQDVSAADSGRTQDALMWKNRVATKEKISLEWAGVTTAEASAILQAFTAEYFSVTYHSPLTNSDVQRLFTGVTHQRRIIGGLTGAEWKRSVLTL